MIKFRKDLEQGSLRWQIVELLTNYGPMQSADIDDVFGRKLTHHIYSLHKVKRIFVLRYEKQDPQPRQPIKNVRVYAVRTSWVQKDAPKPKALTAAQRCRAYAQNKKQRVSSIFNLGASIGQCS